MDFVFVAQRGVVYGLVLSVLFTLVFVAAALFNHEIMLNDYPPDIKKAYGPEKNPGTRGQRRVFSLSLLVALFGVILYSVVNLDHTIPLDFNFLMLFVLVFMEIFTFNLWDLLVIDCLFFNTLQPKFIFLPGTEGMAGYKDHLFHVKGFLTGVAFSLVSALVISGITLILVNAGGKL